MKSNHSIIVMIVALAFTLSISACGNAQKQKEEPSTHAEMNHEDHNHALHGAKQDHIYHETSMTSSSVSKEQAQKILTAYLKIKNALVSPSK